MSDIVHHRKTAPPGNLLQESRFFTAEIAEIAEREKRREKATNITNFLLFFLCGLCDLCGEKIRN